MRTLTRDEAHDVVSMAAGGGLADLQRLSVEWIGHDNEGCTAEELEELLNGFADECAFNGDEERSNGPRGSDDTDLVNPWEAE